jgi:hypothetical protein
MTVKWTVAGRVSFHRKVSFDVELRTRCDFSDLRGVSATIEALRQGSLGVIRFRFALPVR